LELMNPLLCARRTGSAFLSLARCRLGTRRRGCEAGAVVLEASCHRSLRHRTQHSSHSGDVAGCHRQLEVLIDAPESSVDGLAYAPDRLAPAEVFLDALSDGLAYRIAGVAGRAGVDGAAPLMGRVA